MNNMSKQTKILALGYGATKTRRWKKWLAFVKRFGPATGALLIALASSAHADVVISSKVAGDHLHKGDLLVRFSETNVTPLTSIDFQITGLATCNGVTEDVGTIFTLRSNSKGIVGNAIYVEGPGCAKPTYFDMELHDGSGVTIYF